MARGDCSELALEITELAMDIGIDPNVKDLDDVVARMRQFPELAPRISRQLVEDSIIEATAGHAQELTDLQRKLSSILNEARVSGKAREQIRVLKEHAKKGTEPVQEQTAKQQQSNAIKELRSELSDLQKTARLRSGRTGSATMATELAKAHIEAGITDREALVSAVHADMVKLLPELTVRDVRDQISGFGKFTRLSTADADVILRDLKIQLQQESKLEDIAEGIAPLKTGRERPIPSAEARRMIQRVNEAKRAGNFKVTDPETQLKTALDGIKTRLNNQIEDLETEIRTREKIVTQRTPVERDEESLELEQRRDALRETRNEIFGQKDLSDAQRLALAKRATQSQIDELERRVSEGDFSRPGRPIPPTDEALDILRKRRDRLKEQFRKRNPNLPEITRARIRIGDIERHLLAGTLPPPAQRGAQDNPWLVTLRRRQAELQRELNKSPTAQKTRVMKSINEIVRRLDEQDFAPRIKEAPQTTAELDRLRFDQRRLRNELNAQIEAFKAPWFKRWSREIMDVPRAMKSSFDVSAVGRQGNFILINRPDIAAKALKPMFVALKDPVEQQRVMDEIMGRDNFSLYAQGDLFLSATDGTAAFTEKEELFRSTVAEKIPGVGASNRAYSVFLNRIRADYFDVLSATLSKNSQAVSPDEAVVLAHLVNLATGRGAAPLGEFGQTLMFSQRYATSRFQLALATPIYTNKAPFTGTGRARALVAREIGKNILGRSFLVGLFLAFGWDIELDPKSSDFMKIPFGNTRVDIMGGLGQALVFLSRLATGESKRINTGEIMALRGEGWKPRDIRDLIVDTLLWYKLAPTPAAVVNFVSGERIFGEPIVLTTPSGLLEVTEDIFLPISVSDIIEIMQDAGTSNKEIVSALNLFGFSTQTIVPKKSRKKTRSAEELLRSSELLIGR